MLLALLLLSLFLLVLLGFYVFVAAPHSRAHQAFAAFVAGLAVWTVKDIAFWGFSIPEGSAAWWAASSFIIALVLQYPLVAFAWVFPEDRKFPLRRAAILFAPGAIFVPAVVLGWMWAEVGFVGGRFTVRLTPLAYAFGIYTYILFAYGCALLARKYSLYRGTQRGQQLGAILWGLGVTGALNTTANIALPLAGVYSWLPFGSILLLPGVIIYAYAISNFKLFSLSTALDQFRLFPIAYKIALIIAVIAILSFLLLQIPIIYWSFGATVSTADGLRAWRQYLVFSVIAALVPNLLLLALVIRTLSRPLRRVTEAAVAVAAGAYGTEVGITSNDEVGLLARSFNEMSRKMQGDIERLQTMSEQLIRTERLAAAGTLAAGVAHEVNNPLAAVSSLIQILQAQEGGSAETQEMLRLISTQITRITQVLRDMMDFAGATSRARAPVDIADVLEASIRLASFDKSFKRMSVIKTFDTSVPNVLADADALQQVFLNLLLNARDAMHDGDGELRIATRYMRAKGEIVVEIADTGSGILPEHAAHIFDPFFTTKPPGAGTGLGLSVCHRIVTAHDGRIEIEPNNGRGTRARIALPVQLNALPNTLL